MGYTCTLYQSISDVPADTWDELRRDTGGDLAVDRRLISAYEQTMNGRCRCWAALVNDDAGAAVATACFCLFRVDGGDTTGKLARALLRGLRSVWAGVLWFSVLFCGLPVPSGENHLRIRRDADAAEVIRTLEAAARDLARRQSAALIVFKEFDAERCVQLDVLRGLGYVRGDVPASYVLRRRFASFEELCARLRSNYRWKVNHSLKKFERSRLAAECVYGDAIADAYTDDVHRLYEVVWERAKYRLEKLPAEFFRSASRQFGDRASMTIVREADRIAAFAFGLSDEHGEYHNLYGGVDNAVRNGGVDLYFNLQYRDLDYALRRGATAVHFGQTADEFKARLGATPRPLFFYARAVNPALNVALRAAQSLAFPPVEKIPIRDVFKSDAAAGANGEGAP